MPHSCLILWRTSGTVPSLEDVMAAVRECGFVPTGSPATDGIRLVLIHRVTTAKRGWMEAGYFRGRGVPVVVVGEPYSNGLPQWLAARGFLYCDNLAQLTETIRGCFAAAGRGEVGR